MPLDPAIVVEPSRSSLRLNGVPFTDAEGWIDVPLTDELRESLSDHDLRAHIVVRSESTGRTVLCVTALRFRGVEFRSLHALGFARGGGWVRYVPEMIRQRVEAHCAIFPASERTEEHVSTRPPAQISAFRGPTLPSS